MALEIVKEVTQPFHGADGIEVLYQPGDRFAPGEELPYGVRTRLAVIEVPDAAPGKTAVKPARQARAAKT